MTRSRSRGRNFLVRLSVLAMVAAMLPLTGAGVALATHPVSINEIRIDQPGTDTDEYFELAGPAGASLTGLHYIVIGDGAGGSGVIEHVTDLTGLSIPGTGLFVAAEATFSLGAPDLVTSLNFQNSDNVTHLLVENFSGSINQDLDTNDDGNLDITPWTSIVDSGALVETVGSGDQVYGFPRVGPDGPFVPGHVFLCPAGWVVGGFTLGTDDTPGAANVCPPPVGIYDIQGATHLTPVSTEVTTTGIVTAVAFNGYYVQDPGGDGNDDTSDGIFVFVGSSGTKPSVGDAVTLTDTPTEFVPGGCGTGNLSTTQLSFPSIAVNSTGNSLPAPVIIGSSGRIPPAVDVISSDELPAQLQPAFCTGGGALSTFDPAADGIDFYESLEGMLVTVEDPVAVSGTRTFNPFSSEMFTLPNQGANIAPSDARTARGGINLQPSPTNTGDQNPERVQIQFDPTISGGAPVPAITVGDVLDDVTGVVGYSFGNFEVIATGQVTFTPGGLGLETTDLVPVKREVTVASYNVLNLSPDSSDDAQRATLAGHITNNLGSPDVIALQEIQDNNGTVDDGTTAADQTLQALVDAIAAAGGPTYDFFDVAPVDGTSGGVPGGNIRNAFLYNADRVKLVDFMSLTPEALTELGVSDPNAFAGTRNPLAATFKFRGKEFTVINNHLTSRFGSTPVFGGPQPFVQAGEAERAAQTGALNEVVDAFLDEGRGNEFHASKSGRIIVTGDLNTMEFTDDITDILPGPEQVVTNLIDGLTDDNVYTFNFEGNSQVLDHMLVTNNLASAAEFDVVHVNVDFPRVDPAFGSDHEPLVGRFDLNP